MSSNTSLPSRMIRIFADVSAGLAAMGIFIVVLLQVGSRLANVPVSWTEEATRFLFVWMVFLGVAAGFRTVEAARVVVFIASLRSVFKYLAVPIYVGFSVLFFGLMFWTGASLVRQQFMMNETAATLTVPMWAIGIIMPLSALLAILGIVDSLRNRRNQIALPEIGIAQTETDISASNTEKAL